MTYCIRRPHAVILFAMLMLAVAACPAAAQQGPAATAPAAALFESLEAALEAEKGDAAALAVERERLAHLKKILTAEISALKIQQNTFQSLALLPQTDPADIKEAARASNQALETIADRLKDLRHKATQTDAAVTKTEHKIDLYRHQTDELRAWPAGQAQAAASLKVLRRLIEQLADKQKDLKADLAIVGELVTAFETVETSYADLARSLTATIASQTRQQLLQRQWVSFGPQGRQQIITETAPLSHAMADMATPAYWKGIVEALQGAGALPVLAFWGVLGAVLTLLKRLKQAGLLREEDPGMDQTPWRRLGLRMITRSLLLAGAWVVVAGFAQIQPHSPILPWTAATADILVVFLLTNWGLVFGKHAVLPKQGLMDAAEANRLRRMLTGLRLGAFAYLPLDHFFDGTGTLLSLVRLALEAVLAVWCLRFFKRYQTRALRGGANPHPWARPAAWLSYLIVLGGLLIELAGYGFLARHWYCAWAFCLAASLWGVVGFMVLREWQNRIRAAVQPGPAGVAVDPLRWLIVQGCWLVFWVGLVLAQIQAWAAGTRLWPDLLNLTRTPLSIGNISISLAGLAFALLVLVVTYTVSQLARQLLKEKLLDGSGLEPGFQDSLVTMSRYLLWMLGAVMALNVLGVSSTSMAVVFGALSVGLGFGLQNIFNNFVSGIILLFERPIQVGDTVEINGTWAVVKKINVRATLVQTYDNASLIIPNAEFISAQVTNWTHKDQRLRRTVTIGVAYGSDTALVRQVLLDIAASIPQILADPPAQVLFDDFGDSALIFKLRFWTHLEALPRTETEVRFAIDRRFKELGIEIPFPQRDVHIRSLHAPGIPADPKTQPGQSGTEHE